MKSDRYTIQQWCFGWINLTLAVPSIYLWVGLPLVLRQNGWSGLEIGIFQLASLPAVFKFFFAIPVEKFFRTSAWKYQLWAWLSGTPFCLAMLMLSQYEPQQGKATLVVLSFAAAIFATWADIPVNALVIRIFPPTERFRAGSVRSAATFLGAVVGGGVMLMLYQHAGWKAPFIVMAVAVAISLLLLSFVANASANQQQTDSTPSFREWTGFFRRPDISIWMVLLFGFFPSMAAAWVYLKPLLLDYGIAANQVAMIAGIGGGTIGALTSAFATRIRRERVYRILPLSAIANILVLLFLAATFKYGAGSVWLAGIACMALAVAMGMSSSLVFSLVMDLSRAEFGAFDYGIQSSIFTLGRIVIMPFAGILIDRAGYATMLCCLSAISFVLLLVAVRFKGAASAD